MSESFWAPFHSPGGHAVPTVVAHCGTVTAAPRYELPKNSLVTIKKHGRGFVAPHNWPFEAK